MTKLLEVREFDTIIGNQDYQYDNRYKYLELPVFEKLKSFICEFAGNNDNSDVLDFMRINFKRHLGDVITIKNYVGLIQISNSCQIQVLPKISFSSGEDIGNSRTKRIFLKMLCSMKDFPCKVFNEASIKSEKMSLYEIFISMYLEETRRLVKNGIKSGYISQEDNLRYCRGKFLINKQLQYNIAHKERFYMAYDEFLQDRPENRLIKSTLLKLQKQTTSVKNSSEIKQLLTAFEMIAPSVNYQKDFAKSFIDRSTQDYKTLLQWSEVFLMNKGFTTFSGNKSAVALLFPMEKVYESYVAQQIKKFFVPVGWNVSIQDKSHYLFNYKNNEICKKFQLRPDIVLKKENHVVIMDTKWKRLEDNSKSNYGITQADMYQMYAYSKKYRTPDVWLLYPFSDGMHSKEHIFFDTGDGTNVKLHFINLEHIEDNMKELLKSIDV